MQAYNASFAQVYNMRWGSFSQNLAPRLRVFYESTPAGANHHSLLDLCCGTGHLAQHFLDHGYQVTGIDLSPAMLEIARKNTAPYMITGQATFLQADASNFRIEEQFGLVVSTFDALNHLPDVSSLSSCFLSVYAVLLEGGHFIFDLNTLEGLRHWTGISVEDSRELMLITRAVFDEENRKALMRVSGFLLAENGLYERFEETAYEIAFDLQETKQALQAAGFHNVRFVRSQDFHSIVDEPELENRIFVIAEK